MEMIEVHNFPLPISVNHAYDGLVKRLPGGRYKMGRKKSAAYMKYGKACGDWALENRAGVMLMRKYFQAQGKNQTYQMNLAFHFKYSNVFCISKKLHMKPKKMDVSNRIKVLEDELCKILGFDDSQVFVGQQRKLCIESEKEEFVNIVITPLDMHDVHVVFRDEIK